jgi:plasmid stability protein
MPDILIRDLDAPTVKRLKTRAKAHGRSLQAEVRQVLKQSAGDSPQEVARMFAKWKQRFAGRKFPDSAALIRQDRRR